MWQVSWTNGKGERASWNFSNRDRAIYWLNRLVLDLGKYDAKLTRVRRIR